MTEPKTHTDGAGEHHDPRAHEKRVAAAQETQPMPADGGEYRREADGSLTRLDEAHKPPRWKSEPDTEVEAAPLAGSDAVLAEAADAPVTGDAAKPKRRAHNADAAAE